MIFVASAINNKMTQQNPHNNSIHLLHALEEGEIVECGGRYYDDEQIFLAIEYAVHLQRIGETRGFVIFFLFFFLICKKCKKKNIFIQSGVMIAKGIIQSS